MGATQSKYSVEDGKAAGLLQNHSATDFGANELHSSGDVHLEEWSRTELQPANLSETDIVECGLFFFTELSHPTLLQPHTLPLLSLPTSTPYLRSVIPSTQIPHWHLRTAFPAWPHRLTIAPLPPLSTIPSRSPPTPSHISAIFSDTEEIACVERAWEAELRLVGDDEAREAYSFHRANGGNMPQGEKTMRWLKGWKELEMRVMLRTGQVERAQRAQVAGFDSASEDDVVVGPDADRSAQVLYEREKRDAQDRMKPKSSISPDPLSGELWQVMHSQVHSAPLPRIQRPILPERSTALAENCLLLGAVEVRQLVRTKRLSIDGYLEVPRHTFVFGIQSSSSTHSLITPAVRSNFGNTDDQPKMEFSKVRIQPSDFKTNFLPASIYKEYNHNVAVRQAQRARADDASADCRSLHSHHWPDTPISNREHGVRRDTPSSQGNTPRSNATQTDAAQTLRRMPTGSELRRIALLEQERIEQPQRSKTQQLDDEYWTSESPAAIERRTIDFERQLRSLIPLHTLKINEHGVGASVSDVMPHELSIGLMTSEFAMAHEVQDQYELLRVGLTEDCRRRGLLRYVGKAVDVVTKMFGRHRDSLI